MSPGSVKPGQRGERGVRRPADPGLQHPAAPHRDALGEAQVVDANRFEVAADPARLDVGDLAGTELDRVGGARRRHERLVEADRCVDLGGEPGVADDVVLGQRLFDQEQVVVVEPAEMGAVGAPVRRVGVDLERRVRSDEFAHGGDLLDVGARLDLQLDAHVAVVQVPLHRRQQVVGGVVDARR